MKRLKPVNFKYKLYTIKYNYWFEIEVYKWLHISMLYDEACSINHHTLHMICSSWSQFSCTKYIPGNAATSTKWEFRISLIVIMTVHNHLIGNFQCQVYCQLSLQHFCRSNILNQHQLLRNLRFLGTICRINFKTGQFINFGVVLYSLLGF